MKLLNIQDKPLDTLPYLNAGRRPNQFFVDLLPIYHATVDRLPDDVDAVIVCADLQGREMLDNHNRDPQPPRLLGEVLPELLEPVLDRLGINASKRVGAILAGDLYTYRDLHGRGGTGDVTEVWQTFADEFGWVIGVAGNHDTFSDDKHNPGKPRPRTNSYFLDETRLEFAGLSFAGLSGVIGNPRKNFRRTTQDFLDALERLLSTPTDVLVMHDGPDAPVPGCRGIPEVREIIETAQPALVIRGHKHWPQPLVELPSGIQILNVEATVVVLTQAE